MEYSFVFKGSRGGFLCSHWPSSHLLDSHRVLGSYLPANHPVDASQLDASQLDASQLDASQLDASQLGTSAADTLHPDTQVDTAMAGAFQPGRQLLGEGATAGEGGSAGEGGPDRYQKASSRGGQRKWHNVRGTSDTGWYRDAACLSRGGDNVR